jgi:hypothetical protein
LQNDGDLLKKYLFEAIVVHSSLKNQQMSHQGLGVGVWQYIYLHTKAANAT